MNVGIVLDNSVKVSNKVYGFAQNVNLLVEINIENNHISAIGAIPDEDFFSPFLVGGLICVERKLYLIPHNSKKMWEFSLDNYNWTMCELNSIEKDKDNGKFNSAFLFGDSIFMIGFRHPGIVVYDFNKKTECDYRVFSEINDNNINNDGYVRKNCYIKNNTLYAPCTYTNWILKFDLIKYSWKWVKVGDDYKGFAGIVFDGRKFVIPPRYGNSIIIWDENSGKTKDYDICNNFDVFLGAFNNGDEIVIPGKGTTKSLIMRDESVECIENNFLSMDYNDGILYVQDARGIFSIYDNGEKLFSSNLIVDVDIETISNIDIGKNLFQEDKVGMNLKSYLELISVTAF